MKFKIGKEVLSAALEAAKAANGRRQGLPILSEVLLDVQRDVLAIVATNLEYEVTRLTPIKCHSPGRVVVPARKLRDICSELPDGAQLTLASSDDKLVLSSGKYCFTFDAKRPDEFPPMGSGGFVQTVRLPGKDLLAIVEATRPAMGDQDVRYYLNGIQVRISSKRLRATATDGRFLVQSELACDANISGALDVILPRKTVLELVRLLKTVDGPVELRLAKDLIQVDLGSVCLTSKLVDGKFPAHPSSILGPGRSQDVSPRTMPVSAWSPLLE